jgi:hypothetical protein
MPVLSLSKGATVPPCPVPSGLPFPISRRCRGATGMTAGRPGGGGPCRKVRDFFSPGKLKLMKLPNLSAGAGSAVGPSTPGRESRDGEGKVTFTRPARGGDSYFHRLGVRRGQLLSRGRRVILSPA